METPRDIAEIKSSFVDLQSGMHSIYRMVGTSVNGSRTTVAESKYISNQLDYHASRIEDNTRDLHELMGKVDIVKEDVQKLTSMTQWSHFLEFPVVGYLQMEEPSVGQPTHGQEAQNI